MTQSCITFITKEVIQTCITVYKEVQAMEKKIRKIYRVDMGDLVGWDEENQTFGDFLPFCAINDEDTTIVTAHLEKAYRHYRKFEEYVYDDVRMELRSYEIQVTDEEWEKLYSKEILEYDDYKDYTPDSLQWIEIASKQEFHNDVDSFDSVLGELVRQYSENFNMKVICEKSGVNYSTFRGFKNNKKQIDKFKLWQILRTMHKIGLNCWDDDFEKRYQEHLEHKKRYGF